MHTKKEDLQKLAAIISDIRIAMLTTLDSEGHLRSRPMATQEFERSSFDGTLWFLTRIDSPKVQEVGHNHEVNLVYTNKNHAYVSISGRCEVYQDRAKARELWNPLYQAWFPQGLDDPTLSVMKVKITGAEYWATPSNQAVMLLGYVKALATGKPHAGELSEHDKLNIA